MENNRSLKEDDNDDGYPPLNRNSSQRGALINVISPLQKLAADVTAMMVLGTTLVWCINAFRVFALQRILCDIDAWNILSFTRTWAR